MQYCLLLVILFLLFFLVYDKNDYGNSIYMNNDIPDEYAYKDPKKPIYYDFVPQVPPM
jgi:hypothetical protein